MLLLVQLGIMVKVVAIYIDASDHNAKYVYINISLFCLSSSENVLGRLMTVGHIYDGDV